ncbi:MAG: ATP-binding protein [Candidatus Omnitrophica bacterium]|nr:ATP-binding protein [Candidatus Omnitrophota bacterium]
MKRNIWNKLTKWKNKKDRKPLILKGARQVGKTYILQKFGKECFSQVHYLNFEKHKQLVDIFAEDLIPQNILRDLSFYLNTAIDIKNDLIIFDEIQNIPRALTSLKYFQEELPKLAICAAGSLLGIQLSDESFPVGKVEFLNMFPLSFEEFLEGIGEIKSFEFLQDRKKTEIIPQIVHIRLWEQLKIYFVTGGLPEIVSTFKEYKDDVFIALEKTREKQDNLLLAYIADIAKHSGKQNAMHVERLWQNIPAQLAKEQDGSAGKFKFKGVIPGIQRYSKLAGSIDWLVSAGLVIKVRMVNSGLLPFSAHTTENSFKLYVFDVGLLGALSGLPPKSIMDYGYGSYKGYFAENFAAQEFLCSSGKELYCWKEGSAEVEFLREINGEILPIEIKSGGVTQAKSIKVFARKYKSKYRTIFSANNLFIDPINKVHRYPLYLVGDFMKNESDVSSSP